MTEPRGLGDMITDYFNLADAIHKAFGYVEDWVTIPLNDMRNVWWNLSGEGHGDDVVWARKSRDNLSSDDPDEDDIYSAAIYTQRFLSKWVYRTADFTMISISTGVDGNRYLAIFDNEKEVKRS